MTSDLQELGVRTEVPLLEPMQYSSAKIGTRASSLARGYDIFAEIQSASEILLDFLVVAKEPKMNKMDF